MNVYEKWIVVDSLIPTSELFLNNNISKIAIYGGGAMGRCLYSKLINTSVEVVAIIDQNKNLEFPYEVDAFSLEEFKTASVECDAIVIAIAEQRIAYQALYDINVAFDFEVKVIVLTNLFYSLEDLYNFKRLISHLDKTHTKMIVADLTTPLFNIKNPSESEIRVRISPSDCTILRENIALLRKYYDDIENLTDDEILGVFDTDGQNLRNVEKDGIIFLADNESSDYYHVCNGERLTTDVPESNVTNNIYVYGNCCSVGLFADDKNTIPSILQRQLNQRTLSSEKQYRVRNFSNWKPYAESIPQILTTKFNENDIVILLSHEVDNFQFYFRNDNILYLDINDVYSRPHEFGNKEILFDKYHTNHRGYTLIAKRIYSTLSVMDLTWNPNRELYEFADVEAVLKPKESYSSVSKELKSYLSFLIENKSDITGRIGSIVMNCNPFTNGHLYLITEALKRCDYLYIFLVEEDKSFFKFDDRFKMLKAGIKHLENVKILPSGKFILSAATMPEYFTKETNNDVQVDASKDLSLFAQYVAPALDINIRFAGTEPIDNVTKQYNFMMSTYLPECGIGFCEIERMTMSNSAISASKVRALLNKKDFAEIAKIVPETTLYYLKNYWE